MEQRGFSEGCYKFDCLEQTAWQTTTYTIPDPTPLRNVTLKLSVNQGGGGESVALVDDIRITP